MGAGHAKPLLRGGTHAKIDDKAQAVSQMIDFNRKTLTLIVVKIFIVGDHLLIETRTRNQ